MNRYIKGGGGGRKLKQRSGKDCDRKRAAGGQVRIQVLTRDTEREKGER